MTIKADYNLQGDRPWKGARLIKQGDGKLSYQCKNNKHSNCFKLSCPCKCHIEEVESESRDSRTER